jgi:phage FluMu gp28-like protein
MNEDVLLPYQKTWIADESNVKVWEKSRRIGASYVEALASVLEAAKTKESGGQSSYYLSYSKEMTQQFARDCAFWAKHIHAAAEALEVVVLKDEDKDITILPFTVSGLHPVLKYGACRRLRVRFVQSKDV